jgi:hypothetical protein
VQVKLDAVYYFRIGAHHTHDQDLLVRVCRLD